MVFNIIEQEDSFIYNDIHPVVVDLSHSIHDFFSCVLDIYQIARL